MCCYKNCLIDLEEERCSNKYVNLLLIIAYSMILQNSNLEGDNFEILFFQINDLLVKNKYEKLML